MRRSLFVTPCARLSHTRLLLQTRSVRNYCQRNVSGSYLNTSGQPFCCLKLSGPQGLCSGVTSQFRWNSSKSEGASLQEKNEQAVNIDSKHEPVPKKEMGGDGEGEGKKDNTKGDGEDDGSKAKKVGRMAALRALFKGMTFKQIVKQYGIPLALFYWISNELAVAVVTYLLHFNYVSQNSVVDLIDYLGFGSMIDTRILHTHSIILPHGYQISALLVTNFLVASAFLSLFVPVKLPLAIWAFPKVKRAFRKIVPKKANATKSAGAAAAAEGAVPPQPPSPSA